MASDGKLARFGRAVTAAAWAHLPPIVILAIFFVASLFLLDENDAQVSFQAIGPIRNIYGFLPILVYVSGTVAFVWFFVTRSRIQNLMNALRWLKGRDWPEILLLRMPLALFLMSLIGNIVLNFKINIPKFGPYSWDLYFAEVDRLMFGGYDPWVLTHMVFSHFEATKLIDNFYLIWFTIQQFGILYIACLPLRSQVRLTFLITLCLNWILGGVVLATLLPAAGPVYVEALYGDPMFTPLTDLLREQSSQVEIQALALQQLLWDGLTNPEVSPLGISAFPSLHVEAAVNFACLGFAVNRTAGWLLSGFSVIVFIGSVHLGWHYAIDGVAGIILAVTFWHISARIARWWLARTEPRVAVETVGA